MTELKKFTHKIGDLRVAYVPSPYCGMFHVVRRAHPEKKKKTDESNADICGEDEAVERQSFVPPFSDARLAAKSMFRASRVLYQNFLSFWLLPTNNPQFLCAPCLVCNSFVTLRRSTVLF